jgi:hypothetical protein
MSQKQFMEGNNVSTNLAPGTPAETSNQIGSGRWILHSWKQVSAYMGLGVRTVQRYEIQFQLPVHRAAGKKRSAVLAFTDELDAWLQNTPRLYVSPPPRDFPRDFPMEDKASGWQNGKPGFPTGVSNIQQLKVMA